MIFQWNEFQLIPVCYVNKRIILQLINKFLVLFNLIAI